MTDTFTRDLFDWLGQVHADHGLPATAFKLAYAIGQHINRRHGKAWPSQPTLNKATGLCLRTIRDLTHALEQAGHLTIEPHRGRHQTNVYRLAIKRQPDAGLDDDENRQPDAGFKDAKPADRDIKTGKSAHKNRQPAADKPSEEPSDALRRQDGERDAAPRRAPDGAPDSERNFAEFWRQYPKRQGEDGAKRAFRQAVAAGADPKAIIAGAMRYAAAVTDKPDRYIKMPDAWLRDGRWKDEPSRDDDDGGSSGQQRRGKPNPVDEMLRAGGVGRRS